MNKSDNSSMATARNAGISHFLLDNARPALIVSLVVAGLLAWAMSG